MKFALTFDVDTVTRQVTQRLRGKGTDAIRCSFFCLATAAAIHVIPSGYIVRQVYEVPSDAAKNLPASDKLLRAIKTQRDESSVPLALASANCRNMGNPDRFECAVTTQSILERRRTSRFLHDAVPKSIGWTDRPTLERRIAAARSRLKEVTAQANSHRDRLEKLSESAGEDDRKAAAFSQYRSKIDAELQNRKQQLQILDEALVSRDMGERRALFEKKRGEVSRTVDGLNAQMQAATKAFDEAVKPKQERTSLSEQLSQLQAEYGLLSAQIHSWEISVGHKDAGQIPDPDAYRLQAVGNSQFETFRDFRHVRWSLLLGILVFALFEFVRMKLFRSRYFFTPDEVMRETGLKLLDWYASCFSERG